MVEYNLILNDIKDSHNQRRYWRNTFTAVNIHCTTNEKAPQRIVTRSVRRTRSRSDLILLIYHAFISAIHYTFSLPIDREDPFAACIRCRSNDANSSTQTTLHGSDNCFICFGAIVGSELSLSTIEPPIRNRTVPHKPTIGDNTAKKRSKY